MLLVLAVAAAGIVVVVLGGFRPGCIVLGAAVLLAGVLRLLLPTARMGMLAIRSKGLDLLTMLGLGAALVAAAVVVPQHLVRPSSSVGTVTTGGGVVTTTPSR